MDREQVLSDVLSEFANTLVTDFPIQAILDHLVLRIVDVLPISAAGVTLVSSNQMPHYVAASDESALRYEKLQTELGEGPCLAAYRSGGAVAIPDLRTDQNFPAFGPRALSEGLAAVFTFPLHQGDRQLGALDLYRSEPGELDEHDMRAAQTLADVAAAYLVNAQARAELRDSTDHFRESSLHDPLTGLPNRLLFSQLLRHAVQRGRRSHKKLAVLFADLDRFKQVNDVHGHQIGDDLLVAVAERLTRLLRPGDTMARLSGDEFVILCEDLDHEFLAEALATRIGTALTAPFVFGVIELNMTASVGIAFAGLGEDVPELLLQQADAAMYQAKRKGGGRHAVLDLREQELADLRAELEHDLQGATGRGEMRADYQPIVSTDDGRIVGVEALLRWEHPSRGLVPPMTVVPMAEQHGLISEIGRWMLEQACHDRNRWQEDLQHDDLQVSVNVSSHQLMSPTFCGTVESVLSDTHTAPALLTLEVTEGLFVEDIDRAITVLHDLKELGVSFALDNFGTGFLSLSQLRRFPVDFLKIDHAFIGGLGRGKRNSAIVSALVDLGHALDMTIVAEGVETLRQKQEASALGCEFSQGYFFAHPMTADSLDREIHATTAGPRYPLAATA